MRLYCYTMIYQCNTGCQVVYERSLAMARRVDERTHVGAAESEQGKDCGVFS